MPNEVRFRNRKVFNKYPVYVKNTLYMKDEDLIKARKLDLQHRFYILEKIKTEANFNYL